MTMTLSSATARLAREVPQAEHGLDQAIILMSSLLTSMVTARNIPGVAAGTGEMAIQHVGKAIESLVSASGEMAKAHGRLRKVYQETSIGDVGDCPSGAVLHQEVTSLAS